jgi:anti-sigma factor RsiW
MACELWRDKLDLYADGELAPRDAQSLAQHLRVCRDCANAVLERVQMKRSVQSAGKRYEPSADFRQRILKTMEPKPRSRFGWRWKLAAAFAVVLVLLGGVLYSSLNDTRNEQAKVYSEIADLHVATLASAAPVDVISTDRHTVKPWFQGRIPFAFNLPELQGSPYSLLGGRVAYLQQSSGAHLIFQIRQHKISVFIFPQRGDQAWKMPSGVASEVSFNVESWEQNGLRYFVIGDASADDIAALSKLLRDAV